MYIREGGVSTNSQLEQVTFRWVHIIITFFEIERPLFPNETYANQATKSPVGAKAECSCLWVSDTQVGKLQYLKHM